MDSLRGNEGKVRFLIGPEALAPGGGSTPWSDPQRPENKPSEFFNKH
jgi:hypothetical protein